MNTKEFNKVLQNPELLTPEFLSGLEEIMAMYPYFLAARVLHLKILKEQYSFRYNRFLRITAAYTPDRSVLFNYITAGTLDDPKLIEQELEAVFDIELVDEAVVYKLEHPEEKLNLISEIPAVGKEPAGDESPAFNIDDRRTFFEWLRLSSLSPVERDKSAPEKEQQVLKKREIIDKFIMEQPVIPRPEPGIRPDDTYTVPPDMVSDKILITETLAKLYEKQGKYDEAIQAYEILSLKFPEKSVLFATRIEQLRKRI